MVNLLGKKEKLILDNYSLINFMDKVNINGKMEKFILEVGIKVFNMAKVKFILKIKLY